MASLAREEYSDSSDQRWSRPHRATVRSPVHRLGQRRNPLVATPGARDGRTEPSMDSDSVPRERDHATDGRQWAVSPLMPIVIGCKTHDLSRERLRIIGCIILQPSMP